MLDLHAYVALDQRDDAIRLLDSTDGVGHATALPPSSYGTVHVIAEVARGVVVSLIVAGFVTLVVQRYLTRRSQR
jgi:hypothetical protein